MRYFYLPAALVGALATAGPAAAAPDEAFYVNAVYLFNTVSETDTAAAETDFDGDNGQAGYFGYRLLPGLALEAGGVYFEPIDSARSTDSLTSETEHEVSGYTAGLRGTTTFAGLFDIWLGAGLYSWESTFNYEIQYPNFPGAQRTGSDTHSGEDIYYRAGVTLPFTDNIQVTVESAYFELSDFFSSTDSNADFEQRYIGLGLKYNF